MEVLSRLNRELYSYNDDVKGPASLKINNFVSALSPLYIPVSNIYVQPFVAHWHQPAKGFRIDPVEVVEVLPTPVEWLLQTERRKITHIPLAKRDGTRQTLRDVPYFDLHDRIVWGATAMILNEFATLLAE